MYSLRRHFEQIVKREWMHIRCDPESAVDEMFHALQDAIEAEVQNRLTALMMNRGCFTCEHDATAITHSRNANNGWYVLRSTTSSTSSTG